LETSANTIERRVLGVLLEKSLAQPAYYPLSLNAAVAACNQKQNRDPVMSIDEDAVYHVLDDLRHRGLVTVQLPGAGARTKRYRHNVESYFGWDHREQAVLAELLLRGPQTPGELRSRCSRMVPFDDLEAISAVLDSLGAGEPPVVAVLPRAPGQSAIRYRQLLYDKPDQPAPVTPPDVEVTPPTRVTTESTAGDSPGLAADVESLRMTAQELERELAELRESVSAIDRRLGSIESQLL